MNTQETTIKGLVVAGLVSTLIACGGGGGGSTTNEAIVAKGVITALGSIWVNGVEYETPDGGSYSDDDSTSGTASYQVGQVVSLRGTLNSDGVSGTADEVTYEAEIEGTASADNIINGVSIITDQTLTAGVRYEISGFWISDTSIEATYIKVDDDGDNEDEVKGLVEAFTAGSLTVHGVVYTYSGVPAVAVGDYVEIHFNGTTANEVELEDDYFDDLNDGQEVEIEGAVFIPDNLSALCPDGGDFMIDTTCIDMSTVTEWEDGLNGPDDVLPGIRVEAEGYFNSVGVLIAEDMKMRGNQVRVRAIPTDTGGGTFTFFSDAITVTTSDATDMDDIPLATLLSGGIEAIGIRTGSNSMLAISIRVEDAIERNEIRAEVDLNGVNFGVPTVTLMGKVFTIETGATLEIEDVLYTGTLTSFLDLIDDDDNVVNGPRDIVDLDIDVLNGGLVDQIEIEVEDD